MRRIQFMVITLAIALLSATTADATVIYNWHSTSPGTYVTATGGELVITDAAYRSGSIDEGGQRSDSPVLLVSLNFDGVGLNFDGGHDIFVQPRKMGGYAGPLPFVSSLAFNDDGTLTGYLFLYSDSRTEGVEASGGGGDGGWNVYNYGTDDFDSACGHGPTCDGGSGFWQLSRVPEPPVWPLFGLGVLGLFGLLRLRGTA